jgi:hypothetical protein
MGLATSTALLPKATKNQRRRQAPTKQAELRSAGQTRRLSLRDLMSHRLRVAGYAEFTNANTTVH